MSTPRILLAESSAIVLDIEKLCLEETGAHVFTSGDLEETLRTARKIKPWLIYLAFNLPGGGEACCKAMKEDAALRAVPVIMVCSPFGDEPRLSRQAGCDAVVAKPIDRREFLEMGLSLLAPVELESERSLCRTIVACSGHEMFFGGIEDISASGMFVRSSRQVTVGEHLALEFVLPWQGAVPIKVEGRVSWLNNAKRPRNDRLPGGFGVNFDEPDPAASAEIKGYIEFMRVHLGE